MVAYNAGYIFSDASLCPMKKQLFPLKSNTSFLAIRFDGKCKNRQKHIFWMLLLAAFLCYKIYQCSLGDSQIGFDESYVMPQNIV